MEKNCLFGEWTLENTSIDLFLLNVLEAEFFYSLERIHRRPSQFSSLDEPRLFQHVDIV